MKNKLLIILLLFVFACSTKTESPDVLYTKGLKYTYSGSYESAKVVLNKLDEEYPYTENAKSANILLAYVYFATKEYPKMLAVADIYIKMNPLDSYNSYLNYLKALSYFNQIKDYKKDKALIIGFKNTYLEMLRFYPNSPYTLDLKEKNTLIERLEYLKELDIALQYHKNSNCIAALPRYIDIMTKNYKWQGMVKENIQSCFNLLGIQNKTL